MLEEELAKFRAINSREPSDGELKGLSWSRRSPTFSCLNAQILTWSNDIYWPEIDERVRSIAKDADIREGANNDADDCDEDEDENEDEDEAADEEVALELNLFL